MQIVLLDLIILSLALLTLKLRTRARRLPPGPSALPVLGSVHHLTLEFQQKRFQEWSKSYGKIDLSVMGAEVDPRGL